MRRLPRLRLARLVCVTLLTGGTVFADGDTQPARDSKQPIDEAYTAKIHKYTTEPFFSSPLVDYLPASKTVPPRKLCSAISQARQESFPTPKTCTNICGSSKK